MIAMQLHRILLSSLKIISCVALLTSCGPTERQTSRPKQSLFAPLNYLRRQWLSDASYTAASELPSTPSSACEVVSFVVAIQPMTGFPGHSAIAVGSKFRDFGPGPTNYWAGMFWSKLAGVAQWPFVNLEGARWWSNAQRRIHGKRVWDPHRYQLDDDIDLPAVITNLENFVPVEGDMTVLLIPIEVPRDHAQRILAWWDQFYAKRPRFSMPGTHCTSSVIRSFHETESAGDKRASSKFIRMGLIPEITPPLALAAKLLDRGPHRWNAALNYRHRCGIHQGEPLHAIILRLGRDMRGHGLEERLFSRLSEAAERPLWFDPRPDERDTDRSIRYSRQEADGEPTFAPDLIDAHAEEDDDAP